MRTYTVTEYDNEDYYNYANSLDVKSVIAGLRNIARGWLPNYNYTGDEMDFDIFTSHAIIDKAIELLEKKERQ